MKDIILKKLRELEKEHHIKILFACESGSRAWGFPSPDSDFDVRAIYKHDLDWYLALNKQKDSLEMIIDKDLDISAWDIRKTLQAVQKSNASPLEWMQSRIVYHEEAGFVDGLREVAKSFFSPIALMHHYLSMSQRYIEEIEVADKVKLKSYFYALRTSLAAMWIREKQTIPPLELDDLLILVEPKLRKHIQELKLLKMEKQESYHHPLDSMINPFLKETYKDNEIVAKSLPAGNGDFQQLNSFFLQTIKN